MEKKKLKDLQRVLQAVLIPWTHKVKMELNVGVVQTPMRQTVSFGGAGQGGVGVELWGWRLLTEDLLPQPELKVHD